MWTQLSTIVHPAGLHHTQQIVEGFKLVFPRIENLAFKVAIAVPFSGPNDDAKYTLLVLKPLILS